MGRCDRTIRAKLSDKTQTGRLPWRRHNPDEFRLSLLSASPIRKSHRILTGRPNQTPPRLPRSQTNRQKAQKPLFHPATAERWPHLARRPHLHRLQPPTRPLGDRCPHPHCLRQPHHLLPLETPPRQLINSKQTRYS